MNADGNEDPAKFKLIATAGKPRCTFIGYGSFAETITYFQYIFILNTYVKFMLK